MEEGKTCMSSRKIEMGDLWRILFILFMAHHKPYGKKYTRCM